MKKRSGFEIALWSIAALTSCTALSGCLVAGYSTGGGFWVWPGSIALTLVLLLLFFLGRR